MPIAKELDDRLLSAISYLSPGCTVADIGTDHAYLPIALCQRGICNRAVACDVRPGPLASAKTHIAAAGLSDRIDTLLTDGLHGVEVYQPDFVLIFGMGGELIARILSEAAWIRNADIGLVLQPMSRAEVLRGYLTENGFSILGESLSRVERLYQTIYARYTGQREHYTDAELLVGKDRFLLSSPLAADLLQQRIRVLETVAAGKRAGGVLPNYEEALIADLRKKGNMEVL